MYALRARAFPFGLHGSLFEKQQSGKMVPEISTPPLGSCGAAIAKDDSPQTLAKRPPCRRPRLQNSEDVTHSTLP
ncbi:PREDICTED: uncharacterized protein LOC106338744 [Brassica oleracea var. oleracea]|uniref:uncharacterized protein LOC106338744 n=1 Tax=Brassica oleracea var. oleracea TaxID=109376 RepID=UPI0006A702EE|nr:PREDICTED: uncharacterized protein LOC106338744 [Brassica oleracea var. oleracea]